MTTGKYGSCGADGFSPLLLAARQDHAIFISERSAGSSGWPCHTLNKPVLKQPRAKRRMVDPIPLLVGAGLVLLLVIWVWRRFGGR
jgi:hypothetical protein